MKVVENEYGIYDVYKNIKRAWKSAGFKNAAAFSKASQINKTTLSKWKHGTIPDLGSLTVVCNVCDCDIDFLLGKIETRKRRNADIHEETGLSEKAIIKLREYRKVDSTRTKDYKRRVKAAESFSDDVDTTSLEREPVGFGDMLSGIILSNRLNSIRGSIQDLFNEYKEMKVVDPNYSIQDLERDKEYQTYRLIKSFEQIVLEFIDDSVSNRSE